MAKQIGEVLTLAGWKLSGPIQPAMMHNQGEPLAGLIVTWRGERVPDGQRIPLDATTPWGVLSHELMEAFPGSLHVQIEPDADANSLVLSVLASPKHPS